MSVRTMAKVWECSRHSATELLMLLAIADFADDDGNAYPSVNTLAAKCRMKPRNARYCLAALEESGELKVLLNAGPKGANRYRVMLAKLGVQPVAGVQESAGVQSGAGVQPVAATPAMDCRLPLQRVAAEPSLNRQEPPQPVGKRAQGADLFSQFYAAYPRKVGKVAAEKAFKRLSVTPTLLADMLRAISSQGLAEKCRNGEQRYVPHPATWLNAGRWQDEEQSTDALDDDWTRRAA